MSDVRFPQYYREYFKPRRFKGLFGGRGSGKSHCFAGHAVIRAASDAEVRILCVREVQRSIADSVKQLIEDKISEYGLADFFRSTDAEITGINGARILFRGMQNHTAASIKSLEGVDVCWVEEAQTISARSLDLLIPTIRKPGSELWFSWNPEKETDPVDHLLRSGADAEMLVTKVNWNQNPWFPDELRSDMARDKARDPDKYRHVWEGEYRGLSEARIFRNWRVGEVEIPDAAVWFYGVDWGFAKDETAGLRVCFPGDDVAYVDAEVYELGTPTEALPKMLDGLPDARKWPIRADSARPETIDYVRRHGFPKLRAARKGKGSIEDGISFLQGFDIVVSPRCPNLARELASYAYKIDKQTGEILPVAEDKNNHLIDALRYAVEGLHRRGKMVAPVAATTKTRRGADYGVHDDEDEVDNWKTA